MRGREDSVGSLFSVNKCMFGDEVDRDKSRQLTSETGFREASLH